MQVAYRGTSLIRNSTPLGPYSSDMHRALCPPGTFNEAAGSGECSDCPANTNSAAWSTEVACTAGHTGVRGGDFQGSNAASLKVRAPRPGNRFRSSRPGAYGGRGRVCGVWVACCRIRHTAGVANRSLFVVILDNLCLWKQLIIFVRGDS